MAKSKAKDGGKSGAKSKSKDGGKLSAKSKAKDVGNKPSAATLALHKKWRDAAEAMGGPGSRIVINRLAAKKLIFDMLRDEFKPMNITDIYKKLNAIVPSPVLKSCLDGMTLDIPSADGGANSDDDDDDDDPFVNSSKKKKKQSDAPKDDFSGSLCIKMGRNVNTTLYYVNQDKLVNNGNGLPPDERNSLIAKSQKTLAETGALNAQLRYTAAETSKLLSEPTNKEATAILKSEEQHLASLNEKVKDSRKFLVNETKRAKSCKRIRSMADYWWKRRRICIDFLRTMEDCTEGTVSVKKCLAGDGQIEIESDDLVLRDATEAHKSRLNSQHAMRGQGKKQKAESGEGEPSSNFVGLKMDAQGHISRAYIEDSPK